jgi:parallel beta-helix repeat protein
LEIGDYEIYYNSQEDRWEVKNSASKKSDGNIHGANYTGGKVGENSLGFNGVNDTVSCDPLNPDSNVTISAWVKIEDKSKTRAIYDESDGSGGGVFLLRYDSSDNAFRFFYRNNEEDVSGTTDPDTGEWYHVVGVSTGSGGEIWVNGVRENTDTRNLGDFEAELAYIGSRGGNEEFWDGEIDDIRIYNRALSSSEVTALYNYGNDGSSMPPTGGLVAHYNFEHPENPNTAVDTSTITHVPKNNSGSLFPTDLGDVLQGKALADDGNIYDSVQTAVDNATGYVFIGPGTFNESVTVSTNGITLEGTGEDTLIDGSGVGTAIDCQNQSDISIRHITVTTDTGDGIYLGKSSLCKNSKVLEAPDVGIRTSADCIISSSTIESTGTYCINVGGSRTSIESCTIPSSNSAFAAIFFSSDDSIISDCTIINAGIGIQNGSSNGNILLGNRIHNCSDRGIYVNGSNNIIIANNRVSDSTNSDIDIATSSGILTEGNKTGPAN